MPTTDVVVIDRPSPHVAIVTLHRPDRLNALTFEMVDGVRRALLEIGADEQCRAIVLTGRGRGFCAGLDLLGEAEQHSQGPRSPQELARGQERFVAMITAVRAVPQAVIAAVNGPAAGAGMALALASDIRVASTSGRFHVGAVRIGLSGGECGMSYLLPRHVGVARAAEILLTGRPVDAAEAERIGLVSRVVADDALFAAALELAEAVAANSPFSTWMTKRAVWANLDSDFAGAIELENRTQVLASLSDDSREAMVAFAEKRDPHFTGR